MYMPGRGGDDLEDDYVPEEPTATSGDEEESSRHGSSHSNRSLDDDVSRPSGSVVHVEGKEINKRDRKSTRLNSSHVLRSRMPSSA